jgi:hypothetical protein
MDEVFIIGFNDNAYMDREFTSDTKLLEEALDRLLRDAVDALRQTKAWDKAGIALHLVDMGEPACTRRRLWAACSSP